MTVDVANNVPAVSFETHCGVVGEPAFNVTINRDTVVIVERNQFTQLQRTRQRANFVGDAFHHAAVAHEGVGVVVDNVVARTVKLRRQRFSAIAIPTALAIPCPSGPVVVSTPAV